MSDSLLFSNLQEVEMDGKWRNEKHIKNFTTKHRQDVILGSLHMKTVLKWIIKRL